MNVWLVIPAWRRLAVTRLCLAQKAHLVKVLAARGITANVVVVANDGNLGIAADEFGFDTIEAGNVLGARVNAGLQYAGERGADYVAFVGSDSWVHPDVFQFEEPGAVVSGRVLTVVDLPGERLQRTYINNRVGAPPWLIPRSALEPSGFRPANDHSTSGMELSIVQGLRCKPAWRFHDANLAARVEFKTADCMTSYAAMTVRRLGDETSPWELLAEHYPTELVALAVETHEWLGMVAA